MALVDQSRGPHHRYPDQQDGTIGAAYRPETPPTLITIPLPSTLID